MEIKIALFSDTHNKHRQVTLPTCDIAIFAGDATGTGQKHELESFLGWYNKQVQCTVKIFIAGNHDRCFDPKFDFKTNANNWLKEVLANYPNLIYLENSSTEAFGLKIWGSPITPWFHGETWAFNKYRGEEINQVWQQIPKDTDIVVTHGPCANILDYVPSDKYFAGCKDLRVVMEEIKPKIHIGGHIHHDRGDIEYKLHKTEDTIFINASILDNRYEKIADPVVINLEV